jgi:hypothetical protein
MKMQRTAVTIVLLTIVLLALAAIGLAGCKLVPLLGAVDRSMDDGNADALPRSSDESTGFGKLGAIEVGLEPTPTPANKTYTNETYGFRFEYPQSWSLSEQDQGVKLERGTNRLTINFRWMDEEVPPFRTGMGAGDLVYADKIDFLDQVIPAQLLLYEKKSKAVFYGISSEIPAAGLLFTIMLEDLDTDYLEVNISDEVIDEADMILETFDWITVEGQEAARSNDSALQAFLAVKSTPAIGDPIWIQFSLKNQSQEALYLLRWYTPLEGIMGDIFEVQRDGQPISYLGILATRANPAIDSYIFLEPGRAVSAEVDIAQAYDFSQPGTYTIRFRSPRISCLGSSKDELAVTLDELRSVNIPSNEVIVEITGSDTGDEFYSRLTTEEAQQMISSYLLEKKPGLMESPPILVEEEPVKSLWNDLQGQIFVVAQGVFEKEAFLFRRGLVIPLGEAAGGKGLISAVVSDIDEDGKEELYFTYSTGLSPQLGSGMQSRAGMYDPAYDEERVIEANLAYLGTAAVARKGTAFVSLDAVEIDEGGETHFIETLGQLFLEKTEAGVSLKFRLNPDLPADLRRNLLMDG